MKNRTTGSDHINKQTIRDKETHKDITQGEKPVKQKSFIFSSK